MKNFCFLDALNYQLNSFPQTKRLNNCHKRTFNICTELSQSLTESAMAKKSRGIKTFTNKKSTICNQHSAK